MTPEWNQMRLLSDGRTGCPVKRSWDRFAAAKSGVKTLSEDSVAETVESA